MKKRALCTMGVVLSLSLCTSITAFAQDTDKESKTGEVTASVLNVRDGNSTEDSIIGQLENGTEVTIKSRTDNGWYKISYEGSTAYVYADYIDRGSSDSSNRSSSSTGNSSWSGEVLNRTNGVVQGPSGKETYYNMDMSNIVSMMHNLGYSGSYWVRDDGVKMFGDYVMCAANLSVHPRGSKVETSLGTGIVCDTGGFASSNPQQLDIAVTW